MEPVLEVKNLTKNFGGLCAVSNVSMEIMPGELIGLIGPNGAGKTTLFNLLTGVYEPSEGLIEMDVDGKKRQIGGLKPYKITDYGVARTFQNIRLFKSMTVLENVQVAMQRNIRYGTMTAILPKILYLDEPAAGMNPQETADLTNLIHKIREKYHLTVILIEHDMSLVMNICERIYVLDYGKMIANGTPEEIKNNEFVIKAYLGEEI